MITKRYFKTIDDVDITFQVHAAQWMVSLSSITTTAGVQLP